MHDSEASGAGTNDIDRVAYTIKDTARLLSLSVRKVEYMVKAGQLESFTVGKSRRIAGTTIREYVEHQMQQARGAA